LLISKQNPIRSTAATKIRHFSDRLLARRLACERPNGGKLSLRAIAAALAAERHFNERGQPFHPMSVASMLAS
jgi:hypothetical protein